MPALELPLQLLKEAKPFKLIWVPPGKFKMGIGRWDYRFRELKKGYYDFALPSSFTCTLTTGFWMSACTITEYQWNAVMKTTLPGSNLPKVNVSWHEAIDFCERLNALYAHLVPKTYTVSLPTEAQWEYACRAGSKTIYHCGNQKEDLLRVAWAAENSGGHLHEVGELEPNAWDFYDMPGNVTEWCFDSPRVLPRWPKSDWVVRSDAVSIVNNTELRIFRGARFLDPASFAGWFSGFRGVASAAQRTPYRGFRIAVRIAL